LKPKVFVILGILLLVLAYFAPAVQSSLLATLTVDTTPPTVTASNPTQGAVLKTFDQTFRFWAKFSEPVGVYFTIEAVVGTTHFPSDRFYSGGGGVLYDSVNGYFYVTYETVKASNGYFTQPPNTGTWTIDIIAEDVAGNPLHTIIAFTVDPYVTPEGSWTLNGQVLSSSSNFVINTASVTYIFTPASAAVIPFITTVTVESKLGTAAITTLTLTKQTTTPVTWKGTVSYADGSYVIHGFVTDTKGVKIQQFSITGQIGVGAQIDPYYGLILQCVIGALGIVSIGYGVKKWRE